MTFLFSDSESVAKARNYNMGSAGGQGGGVSGNARFAMPRANPGDPLPSPLPEGEEICFLLGK